MKRRVAIVTPWYGPECTGGAELQAAELAERLARYDDVTILTTTSRAFVHDWDVDYFKPGTTRAGSYEVQRFRVAPRDRGLFNDANQDLLGTPPERWRQIRGSRKQFDPFIDESINSPDLEHHLEHRGGRLYDSILFLPYLYGVVVRGIAKIPGKSYLIPCLHDEAYARIPRIEEAFHRVSGLLFNSPGEAELAVQLYGPGIIGKSHIVGEGLAQAAKAARSVPISKPFYLYVGRREPEKGIDLLIDAFRNHHSNGSKRGPSLVLVGAGERSYDDPAADIHDLGFVDESVKVALLQNAVALLNPSRNESYSRVLMEAWRENIPVVANSACLATASAVRESGAGLLAETVDEWTRAFRTLETMNDDARRVLGAHGATYAAERADWDRAIVRLRSAIGFDAPASVKRNGKRIDQVLEGFDDGDAISDYARHIRRRLQHLGYESHIYALNLPPWVEDGERLGPRSIASSDAVIYHHSIGSRAAEIVLASSARKALIYHNVTPAEYFRPYVPAVADQLEEGRAQLAQMVRSFDIFVADSDYNGLELHELGADAVRTISVVNDFHRLDCSPATLLSSLDRATTWLFVGRVVPNKGIHALIDAFEAYLALDDDARLLIVGKYGASDPYFKELKRTIAERRLDAYVTFTGFTHEPQLVAAYRSADVLVCLSEHEGFCVPLVESMFFDVPIVAKALAAVPGTLGTAGLVLEADADAFDVAATVHEVCTNARLRSQIIDSQRIRRRDFLPENIIPLIDRLAADLTATTA